MKVNGVRRLPGGMCITSGQKGVFKDAQKCTESRCRELREGMSPEILLYKHSWSVPNCHHITPWNTIRREPSLQEWKKSVVLYVHHTAALFEWLCALFIITMNNTDHKNMLEPLNKK